MFILLTKMWTETKTSFDLIYFQRSGVYTHWFLHMCLLVLLAYMREWRIFIGKGEALLSWLAICLLFYGFISHLFDDYTNINMWKSDFIQAWNSIKSDCGRFFKIQMQWPLCSRQKISRNWQGIFPISVNDSTVSIFNKTKKSIKT